MKKITTLLIIMIISCSLPVTESRSTSDDYYHEKIREWQDREIPNPATELYGDTLCQYKAMTIVRRLTSKFPTWWTKDTIDIWRTHGEFVYNNYVGDCEDISIFFYAELRKMNIFPDNDLAIRIVDIGKAETHAVVVVYTTDKTIVINNGTVNFETDMFRNVLYEFNLFTLW